MYKWLRVEPTQAKLSETFTFHRPTMDSCQVEAHELHKQGHKAKCSHTGISVMAPTLEDLRSDHYDKRSAAELIEAVLALGKGAPNR